MQIENEYGPESKAYGAAGHNYLDWAAKMAVGLNTGVPWVMCKEDDAPDPMVSYLLLYSFHLPNLLNWLMHLFNSKIYIWWKIRFQTLGLIYLYLGNR